MSLSCTKDFTITVPSPTVDMPLDQAVYHAANDAIYAVRGGYIFNLNASTGALVSSNRFAAFSFFNSSLAHDTTNDKLFVSVWNAPQVPSTILYDYKRIYKITPATLALDASYDMTSYGDSSYANPCEGPGPILFGNNLLFNASYESSGRGVDSYDPTNFAAFSANLIGSLDTFGTDLAIDSNNFIWAVRPNLGRIYTNGPDVWWAVTGGLVPTGVCVYPGTPDNLFVCTGTQYIDRIALGTGAITPINTGRANANPHRIRYNANDGHIWCPLYNDDTVAEIDPADNSVTIHTGFDAPWDMVFTPTKTFAVQHGNTGLLEVTT